MRVYLISTSHLTSEEVPEKYLKSAKSEECFYRQSIPTAYLNEPEKYGWPADIPQRFQDSVDICRETVNNRHGQEIQWTAFDYPGHRWFVEIDNLNEMEKLLEQFGGQATFHKIGLENSSFTYKREEDRECLLGMPDIGESWILEIHDDKIEETLAGLNEDI